VYRTVWVLAPRSWLRVVDADEFLLVMLKLGWKLGIRPEERRAHTLLVVYDIVLSKWLTPQQAMNSVVPRYNILFEPVGQRSR